MKMFYDCIIFGVFLLGVLETTARPQLYQYTVPCPITCPVSPEAAQSPTLNIVVRTAEPLKEPKAAKDETYQSPSSPPSPSPPPSPSSPPSPSPPLCPCSPQCACPYFCPCRYPSGSNANPRRFCTSLCSLPGAIMDSILSGEVNL